MSLQGAKVTVLMSGSIAAYKSAELVREYVKRGAEVQVVMSKAACEFITPLTMQALSGRPVMTDLFDASDEATIGHIRVADKSQVVVCAPATADLIAKVRAGMASDAVTAIILATKSPVVFAPAMNVNMWDNQITQMNIRELSQLGYHFVDPEHGELACGWEGKGRLAALDAIVHKTEFLLSEKDLVNIEVIVTAGGTREFFDPVRFVGNRSSGKMGYALARASSRRGALTHLITAPSELPIPPAVDVAKILTAQELRDMVFRKLETPVLEDRGARTKATIVFMAAAVADYKPHTASNDKLKSDKTKNIELSFVPTVDILKELGERRREMEDLRGHPVILVGFCVETGGDERLITSARGKILRKRCDFIIGNRAEDAFEKDTNRVFLVDKDEEVEEIPLMDKEDLANLLITNVLERNTRTTVK